MSHADVQNAANALLDELERAIVGKRDVLKLIVTSILADGHILLEDVPGVAKTAIARAIAEAAGLQFARVQFTPDLIPADITGASILTPTSEIEFQPGPVFANLVLGDEINRAPPKTQSALLEAMEERQVTADGETRPLPKPFLVVGTQNPVEQEGTYPLPEAQLDRFLIRTGIGYPGTENEVNLLLRRAERKMDRQALNPVFGPDQLIALQQRVEEVHISQPVARYVVAIVEATRNTPMTEVGASPRGSLALLKAGRAHAAIQGRSHVLPDDIKAVALPALSHRLILQPDQWIRGVKNEDVVGQILTEIPAPVSTNPGDAQNAGLAAHQQPITPQGGHPQQGPQPQPGYPQDGFQQQAQPQPGQLQQQPQPAQPQPANVQHQQQAQQHQSNPGS